MIYDDEQKNDSNIGKEVNALFFLICFHLESVADSLAAFFFQIH